MISNTVFWLLTLTVIVPAYLSVTVKNVFHAALFLVLSMSGVAGFFAFLGADFLFAVQILLYVGGVLTVLLFVVLLSGRPSDWSLRQVNNQWPAALLLSLTVLGVLIQAVRYFPEGVFQLPQATSAGMGRLFLTDMLVPFEAISLVLLAALIGAVYFAQKSDPPEPKGGK